MITAQELKQKLVGQSLERAHELETLITKELGKLTESETDVYNIYVEGMSHKDTAIVTRLMQNAGYHNVKVKLAGGQLERCMTIEFRLTPISNHVNPDQPWPRG